MTLIHFVMSNKKHYLNKNVCISKGCPFYHCSSRPKFKNGIMDCNKKYMCLKYCKEIKDVNRCE